MILSAGQGRRLLPLTESRPKCLLPVGGRTVLEWQLRALAANGITEATVVIGFAAAAVETALQAMPDPGIRVRTLFNPFFAVSDNLGSCYLARELLLRNDTVLLNGDTVFEPALLRRALEQAVAPVTVTIDRKADYDDDDMKVTFEGTRLRAIGKTLPREQVSGESIGLLMFRGGGAEFVRGVEAALRRPEGLRRWYLSVIDTLAAEVEIRVASIEGFRWGEIDFPQDVERAERLAQNWREAEAVLAAN